MNICVNEKCYLYNSCRRSEVNNKDIIGGSYIKFDGEECFRGLDNEKTKDTNNTQD